MMFRGILIAKHFAGDLILNANSPYVSLHEPWVSEQSYMAGFMYKEVLSVHA